MTALSFAAQKLDEIIMPAGAILEAVGKGCGTFLRPRSDDAPCRDWQGRNSNVELRGKGPSSAAKKPPKRV